MKDSSRNVLKTAWREFVQSFRDEPRIGQQEVLTVKQETAIQKPEITIVPRIGVESIREDRPEFKRVYTIELDSRATLKIDARSAYPPPLLTEVGSE